MAGPGPGWWRPGPTGPAALEEPGGEGVAGGGSDPPGTVGAP